MFLSYSCLLTCFLERHREKMMKMEFDFFNTYKPGEYELKQYFRTYGHVVEDVSNDPAYWTKDIDLIVEHTTLEVKWDKWIATTGNLFIELSNPRSIGGDGWFNFCEAEYLAYGDARNRIFYFIHMNDLREHIAQHAHELQYRTTPDGSYGILLPLFNVKHLIAKTIEL